MSLTELQRKRELYDSNRRRFVLNFLRSDPILEPMLQSVPDPFDAYGPPKPEDQIFSILSPLAIYNSSSSDLHDLNSSIPNANSTDENGSSSGTDSWNGETLAGKSSMGTLNGRQHASDELAKADGRIPWPESKTPRPSPPPSIRGLASSSSSTTTLKSPTTSPQRRSSFPAGVASSSGSGVSVSSTSGAGSGVQPQQRMRSEAKLRNVLSAISEKSGGHSQAPSQIESEVHSRSSSASSASYHGRESSHDTLRATTTPRENSELLNGHPGEHEQWSTDSPKENDLFAPPNSSAGDATASSG